MGRRTRTAGERSRNQTNSCQAALGGKMDVFRGRHSLAGGGRWGKGLQRGDTFPGEGRTVREGQVAPWQCRPRLDPSRLRWGPRCCSSEGAYDNVVKHLSRRFASCLTAMLPRYGCLHQASHSGGAKASQRTPCGATHRRGLCKGTRVCRALREGTRICLVRLRQPSRSRFHALLRRGTTLPGKVPSKHVPPPNHAGDPGGPTNIQHFEFGAVEASALSWGISKGAAWRKVAGNL